MKTTAIGQSVARVDAPAKTQGTARYTGDFRLPRMVVARLVRSPHAHARVVSVETAAAAALPGVLAILTRDNAPVLRYSSRPVDAAAPGARGRGADETLFDDKVRHVGDPVALVAAVDVETVEEAIDRLEVTYEALPPVLDPESALDPAAPLVHERRAGNLIAHVQIGDPREAAEGFSRAELVIERQYQTPRQKHAQLEPHVCVADWDGALLTVWTPSQSPHQLRANLASLWELPLASVRVIVPNVGGGFGNRLGFVLEPYATAMTMHLRRPVRLSLDRLEDFTNSESRHSMKITVKAGGRRDGTLTALHVTSILDAGAYAGASVDVAHIHAQLGTRLYRCARRFDGFVVYTTTPPSGSFRGLGGPQAAFSVEQCLDELAAALGWDAIEFRRRNALRLGDLDPWTHLEIRSWALDEVVDRGRTAINWDGLRGRRLRDGPWRRGVGMAPVMHVSGANCISPRRVEGAAAWVRIHADGRVEVFCGQAEIGTGVATMVAQIAAVELTLPLDQIAVTLGDTATTPYDSGVHSSRSAFTTGWAVRLAAEQARGQLLEAASGIFEAAADDLEMADGTVRVKGVPEQAKSLREVAGYASRILGEVIGTGEAPISNAPPFGAHFADVSVHEETGQIRVNRYVAVHDVGRALNRATVEGQIEGGVAQGLGFVLWEEVVLDPETGTLLNAGLMDYRVPTAADVPPIEVILVEHPDPAGPYGAKGVGEVAITPPPGAIANAVADAIGVRVRRAPLTPDRICAAMNSRRGAP